MQQIIDQLKREAVTFYEGVRDVPVTPSVTPEEIRRTLDARYDFRSPVPAPELIARVSALLRQWIVQVTHPRYFGLFNPSVFPVTVAADALVALYNPQLAGWRHAPAANEIERHVLRFFLLLIGYDPEASAAHFTTGGQEANLTSVLVALAHRFPEIGESGLRALPAQPVLYVSEESHHSFFKIAQSTGLGRQAIRVIRVDAALRMDVDALQRTVESDRKAGLLPFFVVATAGTTAAGIVDPLEELAEVAQAHRLWLHLDAAWGGTALLSPRLKPCLKGIEKADSVTWDAHKWLSVPLGAGMFFSRWPEAVSRAFQVSASSYFPPGQTGATDNYLTSLQWSRRFIGLKVFMALAELGVDGYREIIEHQVDMAEELRRRLRASGWTIVNETPLPLICFTHPSIDAKTPTVADIVARVNEQGRCWVSEVTLAGRKRAVRACITSFRTEVGDIEVLMEDLNRALTRRTGSAPAPRTSSQRETSH